MQNVMSSLLEGRPVRWTQLAVVAVVLFALILDGLDVQLLAFVTPLIIEEWQVDRATFGPALAAAVGGMALGASVGGWMGDRWGRKPVLVASTLMFGLTTAAASLADGVVLLFALRLISGFGFGAATPNGFALATEWLPQRLRPRVISLLAMAAPLGGMIGASGALLLLPTYGWRGCFVICGALTVLLGLVMLAWLPESASYLLQRGKNAAANRTLARVAGLKAELPHAQTEAPQAREAGSIFTGELLRLNVGASTTFFGVAFVTYALSSWMPVILTTASLSMSDAIRGSLYFNTFAIAGALLTSFLISRWGSRSVLVGSCLAASGLIVFITWMLLSGEALESEWIKQVLLVSVGLSGSATGVATTAVYAVLTLGYPLACRSTGIGFGVMTGRVGGIVAIMSSGLLLRIGGEDPSLFFAVLIGALILAIAAAFVVDRHIAGRGRGPAADASVPAPTH